MTTELSLEKQFMLRVFEVVTLPSLTRAKAIDHTLKYVYAHIGIQQQLRGVKGAIKPESLVEYISTQTYVCNPLLSEERIRSIALEAYETYLRSLQQLSNLTANKERN